MSDKTPADKAPTDKVPTDKVIADRRMLESLVCPLTYAVLTYDAAKQELISKAAHLAFPIRDGIPVMLVSEARAID